MKEIFFTPLTEAETLVPSTTAFEFLPKKKNIGVQKRLFKKLKRYGALEPVFNKVKVYTEHIPDANSLSALHQQMNQCCRISGRHPKRLIVGAQDWRELILSQEIHRQYISVQDDKILFGMQVEIIPWMKGIICLP